LKLNTGSYINASIPKQGRQSVRLTRARLLKKSLTGFRQGQQKSKGSLFFPDLLAFKKRTLMQFFRASPL
jgi:hypothetical protein